MVCLQDRGLCQVTTFETFGERVAIAYFRGLETIGEDAYASPSEAERRWWDTWWESYSNSRIREVNVNPDTLVERVYDALRATGRKDLADEFSDWYESLEVDA